MFATNVRARPLVSCICTPALSPCIQYCQISKWDKYTKVMLSGTCFMSFTNYPLDEQLCRVLSVSHSNSIHEVEIGHILLLLWEVDKGNTLGLLQVVLRGSISYNTEFQRPLQYKLELRHLPDNYTFMVLEDAMYSVQVCTTSLIGARLLGRCSKNKIEIQNVIFH